MTNSNLPYVYGLALNDWITAMTDSDGYVDVAALNAWIAANTVQLNPPTTPPVVPSVPAYRANKALIFSRPFSDGASWANGRSTAYPAANSAGSQLNPGNSKLDSINPATARPTDDGWFTAIKLGTTVKVAGVSLPQWSTQLVTTEGSATKFMARTNDVIAFDFMPYADSGAWPAVWTWNGPSKELDALEYHADNPTTAELTNHVVSTSKADYPKVLTPGQVSHFEVLAGQTSVDWYIDGNLIYQDKVGVGLSWQAYLIVNLSVAAGNQYHPGPAAGVNTLKAQIANVSVYR